MKNIIIFVVFCPKTGQFLLSFWANVGLNGFLGLKSFAQITKGTLVVIYIFYCHIIWIF